MTDKTAEYRVTIEGPEKAREQLLNTLKKLEGEASRSGINVTVERIRHEKTDLEVDFDEVR